MKNLSETILKLLKHKISSPCLRNKNREDAEQKHLSMILGFGKGFTLIELLVVVLIIGILSAVALPKYQVAVEKARVVEQMVLLDAVMKAQQIYYMANGVYTEDLSVLDIEVPGNVHCMLSQNNATDVYCQFWKNKSEIILQYTLNKQKRETDYCIATAEIGDKVCKSLSGQSSPTGHSSGNRYYVLNL